MVQYSVSFSRRSGYWGRESLGVADPTPPRRQSVTPITDRDETTAQPTQMNCEIP